MSLIAYRSRRFPRCGRSPSTSPPAQQGEIGAMQTWLRDWELEPDRVDSPRCRGCPTARPVNGRADAGDGHPAGDGPRLRDAQGVEVDRQFLTLMINHHLGGIHMIDGVLGETDNAEVLRVARTMKATQQTELNNLRQLQAQAKGLMRLADVWHHRAPRRPRRRPGAGGGGPRVMREPPPVQAAVRFQRRISSPRY